MVEETEVQGFSSSVLGAFQFCVMDSELESSFLSGDSFVRKGGEGRQREAGR